MLPYILVEKYIYILELEMASSGNRHCANCIGTRSFPMFFSGRPTGPPGSPGQTVVKRLRVCILVGLQLRRRSVVIDSKQSATKTELQDESIRILLSGKRRRSSQDAGEKVMNIVLRLIGLLIVSICIIVTASVFFQRSIQS